MSDAKSPQDLSMDEILATIRRIISEDEQSSVAPRRADVASPARPSEAALPAEAAKPAADADAHPEVLDLTHALNDDGSVRRLAPIGPVSAAAERPREPSLGDPPSDVSETRREPELRIDAGGSTPIAEQGSGGNDPRLVAEVTSLAAAAAFARLAAAPRERREPPLVGDRPLDDIVCDLLRPLLQTWLDENLPGLVERLVQAEIARIASRSGPG